MQKFNFSSYPTAKQWELIGARPHHGIAVPLFSLHSKNSCGIGEYLDLIPLISFCKEIGMDVIQLLPLNDTGQEVSPYSALSAFALNPIHLSLTTLPQIEKNPAFLHQIEQLKQLSHAQRVPYSEVLKEKGDFLRAYYFQFAPSIKEDQEYQAFKEENKSWLLDYSFFKTIKIQRGWQSWELWPLLYRDSTPQFLKDPPEEIAAEIDYHSYVQYLCFQQLAQVKDHADREGVFLKGDIPIMINKESASVWRNKQLFFLQLCAGAPPDMYSKVGQKWGFPLYDWNAMAAQDYQWWKNRLRIAAKFYHLYRIDHIVGFFRIWAIPLSRPALEGHFIPENREEWIPHGEKIMRMMIEASSMLPIGEDLGVVPPEVRVSLRSLGICGTKVMRWERRWDQDRGFIDPADYIPESMTTVSTHDSETLYLWWKNQPEEAELYAKTFGLAYAPQLTPENRQAILRASHQSGSLFHINLLQEYLALIPGLTSPNPEDERINVPGVISELNWTYRFRPSIEEIATNAILKRTMSDIVNNS